MQNLLHKLLFCAPLFLCCQTFAGTSCLQSPYTALNAEYSDRFGLVVNPIYANIIDPCNALRLEIAFGGSEFRMGATWAHAFNPHQRFKATAEYLSQNSTFEFIAGPATQWNEQHAFGALYQYLFLNPWFESVNISAFHAYATGENLSTISFQHPDQITIDDRHIVGSESNGLSTGVTLQPWRNSAVDVNVFYDSIHYRAHDEVAPNRNGIGGGIGLQQILSRRVKFNLAGTHRELFNQLQAGISWLLPTKRGTQLELNLHGAYISGDLPEPKETRIGLMLSYHWNGSCCNNPIIYGPDDLVLWSTPAVRMPQTFVVRDEHVYSTPKM